jgi:hypothetical protein
MMQNSPILISLVFLSTLSALGGCEDPDALTGELANLDGLELQDEQHGDAILDDLEAQDDNQHVDAQGPASLSAPRPDPLEIGWAYYTSQYSTTSGGGTWGSILRIELFQTEPIDSSEAHFRIKKKDGSSFTTSGTVSLRRGSSNGTIVLSAPISAGALSKDFYLDFNDISWTQGKYIDFYGRVVSNSGYSWVGNIRVTKGTYP